MGASPASSAPQASYHGANAFGLRRSISLTSTLAVTDFKLRYAGSVLGYFWSVCKPLMLFGVLYLVFTHALKFGEGVPYFPLQLLLAIVLWAFFSEATGAAVNVLVLRADMVRKIAFPRIVLPISVGMTALLAMLFNLIAVLVYVLISELPTSWQWLWIPPLLVELGLFTLGVSLILSSLYVRFRDIGQLWQVGLQMLFYATPIIYPIQLIKDTHLKRVMLANPLAQIVNDARHCLVNIDTSSTAELLGPWIWVPFTIVAVVVLAGVLLYRALTPRMAEYL